VFGRDVKLTVAKLSMQRTTVGYSEGRMERLDWPKKKPQYDWMKGIVAGYFTLVDI